MRDDFASGVKETLAKRVGMLCSNPNCRKPTSGPRDDPAKFVNIGVAAHITAAAPDGPRYDANLSPVDRSSIVNGIWLCQNCASMIDRDTDRYTVEFIRDWKHQAERNARHRLESVGKATESRDLPRVAFSRLFCGRNKGTDFLVGRDEELKNLDACWESQGKIKVLTLVAWGGMGKTSVVANWAAKKLAESNCCGLERYFDWSFYSQGTSYERGVPALGHIASADLFLKQALQFFGDENLAVSNVGAWQKGERLAQLAAKQRTLLILDGVEPLQDARTGELRDDGLRALLRGLAMHNSGLCIVTTRQHLPDLLTWRSTTAPVWCLASLTDAAGAALLTKLGVVGGEMEKHNLNMMVKGHPLTLTLIGSYLRRAYHGEIRRVDCLNLEKVSEKEMGGHAFRVISAYERWFEQNDCIIELTILRILGLFDRPAPPDCIAALRHPPIDGLSSEIAQCDDADWNEAVANLVELRLVAEQVWQHQRLFGYDEDVAAKASEAFVKNRKFVFPEPKPFVSGSVVLDTLYALDAHPLVREYFRCSLRKTRYETYQQSHGRIFEHLQRSVPFWPEGIEGIQLLYNAIAHGCESGRVQEAFESVYRDRVSRLAMHYSRMKLGLHNSDLAALSCFFSLPWQRVFPSVSVDGQAWLFGNVSHALRCLGRVSEAVGPLLAALEISKKQGDPSNEARRWGNLSLITALAGQVGDAIEFADNAIKCADRSDDPVTRIMMRTARAEALLHAGNFDESREFFEQSEAMMVTFGTLHRELTSNAGYRYSELQLIGIEKVLWRSWLRLEAEDIIESPNHKQRLRRVASRASDSLAWDAKIGHERLSIALGNLTVTKVEFYRALIKGDRPTLLLRCEQQFAKCVAMLHECAQYDYVPEALLLYSWALAVRSGLGVGQAQLDEAWQLSERGSMLRHKADIHLHRARLFFRKGDYPWESPAADLAAAERLINECGYHRRDEELVDAKKAILGK